LEYTVSGGYAKNPNYDLHPKTLKSIITQAGFTVAEFLELL